LIAANLNSKLQNYSFNEHKHRYAVWTAARAQRAFATNELIASAIEEADIRSFIESTDGISQEEFDAYHKEWCTKIIDFFGDDKCKYGRAAKIVSIYLKTAIVLPQQGISPLCNIIHPPIDKILLSNIASRTPLKHFAKVTWTTMTKEKYWKVVDDIRAAFGKCNWEIEQFWNLVNEEN
jgi:hypothetical protein